MTSGMTRRDLLKLGALLPLGPELLAQCIRATSHGRFALSAIGWIDQTVVPGSGILSPRSGNRLRWLYPSNMPTSVGGPPLGIPDSFVVERATIHVEGESQFNPNPTIGSMPTMIAPRIAWAAVGPTTGTDVLELPTVGQALYFDYGGRDSEIIVEDADGVATNNYLLKHGCRFYIEVPEIKRIRFMSAGDASGASNVKYLDLYNDTWLNGTWTSIAQLDIAQTIRDASHQLATVHDPLLPGLTNRLASAGILAAEQIEIWKSVVQAFDETSGGGTGLPAGLSPWDVFSLSTQATWKTSVLSGFGFIDGGNDASYPHDRPGETPRLNAPSQSSIAYRIRTRDASRRSNYVIVNAGLAPNLATPTSLSADKFFVAPVPINNNTDGSVITDPSQSPASYRIQANGEINWIERNYWESGIELSLIPRVLPPNADPTPTRYVPKSFVDLSRLGNARCQIDLTGDQWTIDAVARSFDGWDRVSMDASIVIRPQLNFSPTPPVLKDGMFDPLAKQVTISKDATFNWSLDDFSSKHDPHVLVYQKAAEAAVAQVTILSVMPQGREQYIVNLGSPIDPNLFVGGQLSADPLSARIDSILGSAVSVSFAFETSACDDNPVSTGSQIFQPGPARVLQSQSDPKLWKSAGAEWLPDSSVPTHITIKDFVQVPNQFPPLDRVEVAIFAARVELRSFGVPVSGSFSNNITVLKPPFPPPHPGSYRITASGVDYYGRTLIQISMQEFEEGKFEVWWSLSFETWSVMAPPPPGNRLPTNPTFTRDELNPYNDSDSRTPWFLRSAQRGVIGTQETFEGHQLYELIPIDYFNKDVLITVGVRRINEAGQVSEFSYGEFLGMAP